MPPESERTDQMAKNKKEEPLPEEQERQTAAEGPEEEQTGPVEQKDEAKDPTPTKEEIADEHDRFLRLIAEYDNFRKRSAKERENIYTDVRVDTVTKFLPVYDNLQRAMNTQTSDEAFKKGVEMTFNQLKQVMTSLGVEEIPTEGQKFDPEVHNAVMHVEDDSFGENMIVEEFQKGFKLGGKVIRFSMVKVAN